MIAKRSRTEKLNFAKEASDTGDGDGEVVGEVVVEAAFTVGVGVGLAAA